MPLAARVGDFHTCPMVTPGLPPIPHVGGPVLPPGKPTVLVGGAPAATVGDKAVCVGPVDTIVAGSPSVLICNKPAARMGDPTAHGGVIAKGCHNVLIGGAVAPAVPPARPGLFANIVAGAKKAAQTVKAKVLKKGAADSAAYCQI